MKIELNEKQLKVLNDALIELPFKIAAPIINHINNEINKNIELSNTIKKSNDEPLINT